MKLLFLFLILCLHSIGQVPVVFTVDNADSTIVRVYEIGNINDDINQDFTFTLNNDLTNPLVKNEYLIRFEEHHYYLITFTLHGTNTTKNVYIKTEKSVKGYPFNINVDFTNDKATSIRYNSTKKNYEYLNYYQTN